MIRAGIGGDISEMGGICIVICGVVVKFAAMKERINRHLQPPKHGLYDPRYEHDSCGVGFVADVRGRAA